MIRVEYWIGTTRFTGKAKTYRGAMRIASRNSNAYDPKFYDDKTGQELADDGSGLSYLEREIETGERLYAVYGH